MNFSGKEISEIVDIIEDAIEGLPANQVAIACLVVAIFSQNPDAAPAVVQQCVQSMSELMAAALHGNGKVN
jgi:hypothetical protein